MKQNIKLQHPESLPYQLQIDTIHKAPTTLIVILKLTATSDLRSVFINKIVDVPGTHSPLEVKYYIVDANPDEKETCHKMPIEFITKQDFHILIRDTSLLDEAESEQIIYYGCDRIPMRAREYAELRAQSFFRTVPKVSPEAQDVTSELNIS